MPLVHAPAADRTLIDRLADLSSACGTHRPISFVEREAAVVPGQTAMSDDAPGLFLQVRNHLLITDIENTAARQHPAPMRHQVLVALIITSEFGEIVGVVLLG